MFNFKFWNISRPWTPTKRRGPISAELASPGPACVQLPQLLGTKVVDSKRQAAPAFSLGQKPKAKVETFGPGNFFSSIFFFYI